MSSMSLQPEGTGQESTPKGAEPGSTSLAAESVTPQKVWKSAFTAAMERPYPPRDEGNRPIPAGPDGEYRTPDAKLGPVSQEGNW
jgi:hypothetical protein